MPRWNISPEDRFWSKVRKTDTCWLWVGRKKDQRQGYGGIYFRGRERRAHTVSWEIHNGPIAEGLKVLHRCDNPVCVRPDHLFLGTQADNVQDMISKGRMWAQSKTHCKNGHPLSGENLITTPTQRRCRICAKAYREAYNQRRAS